MSGLVRGAVPVEARCADRERGMTKELGRACARDIV
jgi:hypothetical protein